MSADTAPARTLPLAVRILTAVAVTVAVFVTNDQLVWWVVPPVPYRTFLVAMAVVAGVVLLATRGRVALPRPTEPWPTRPRIEPAARAALWLLIVPTLAAGAHLLIGLWWPNVDDDRAPIWAPLYQNLVRAPLWEELVWRGIVLGVLLRLLPARAAIVVSAAAFALIHFDQGYRGPGLVDTFALGIVAGVIAWHTGRLWLAIAAHAAYNAGYLGAAVALVVLLVWLAHHLRTDRQRLEQQIVAIAAHLRRRPRP